MCTSLKARRDASTARKKARINLVAITRRATKARVDKNILIYMLIL